MASVPELIERVRSHGANVTIDGGKLRVINGRKLPDGALDYIKKHGAEVAAFLDTEAEFDERAAIIEYDGGLTRAVAEYLTKLLMSSAPSGANAEDWSWFVGEAAKAIDGSNLRRAA
jgi:hypothetical protein